MRHNLSKTCYSHNYEISNSRIKYGLGNSGLILVPLQRVLEFRKYTNFQIRRSHREANSIGLTQYTVIVLSNHL